MELELLRLRFFGFSTLTSGSEEPLVLSGESSSESLVVESLFDLGLGVRSFFDFLDFSSGIVANFLGPSTWSDVLWLGFLSLDSRGSVIFSGVSVSTGGGVAESPVRKFPLAFETLSVLMCVCYANS